MIHPYHVQSDIGRELGYEPGTVPGTYLDHHGRERCLQCDAFLAECCSHLGPKPAVLDLCAVCGGAAVQWAEAWVSCNTGEIHDDTGADYDEAWRQGRTYCPDCEREGRDCNPHISCHLDDDRTASWRPELARDYCPERPQ